MSGPPPNDQAASNPSLDASSADWPPRLARETALREIEARIADQPEALEPRVERAGLLFELGRILDARNAYLEVLSRAPAHRLALNHLGALLQATGYSTAARTAFSEAAARHPEDPMSQVNLANALYENRQFEEARQHYELALGSAPDYAEAHQGLSYVLAELGDPVQAAHHRQKGFGQRALVTLPYRGERPPIRVLQLISALGGNIPTRNFLDNRVFETTVLVAEFFDASRPLPRHQVIFNAIGDADLSAEALRAAQALLASSGAPVLNSPAAVLATGRTGNAQRLSGIPGLIAPRTITLPREVFRAPDAARLLESHGFRFPVLVRTPGFHTGRHFVLIERASVLQEAIAGLPGEELTAIQYLDSRGADGQVRKYRVMMIDGRLYPLHAAISSHWKIHYFSAEMADRAENRAEDAEFLENMPAAIGPRAMQALAEVQRALNLDYAGMDFGLSPAGDLLLFEANATMVVNPPEPDQRWSYRRPYVQEIFNAVHRMLIRKAGL